MTDTTDAAQPGTGLISALHVDGPAAEHAGKLMLFGRFVGSWHLDWAGTGPGGQPAAMTGELHVGWVLGGRAVQDVWIVPGREQPGEGHPPLAFHGSTIRFYDPAIDAWRSTWIEPVNARVRRFIGRPSGGDIVLLSDEEDPSCGGGSPTSPPTHSPGAPRLPATAAPPGTSTSRCRPPGWIPDEPCVVPSRSACQHQRQRPENAGAHNQPHEQPCGWPFMPHRTG